MQQLYKPLEVTEDAEELKSLVFIDKHMINSLGPCHYEAKDQLVSRSTKTPIWSHSRSKRICPPKPPTADNPGPGHYNQ
jgi:hypothetical protein